MTRPACNDRFVPRVCALLLVAGSGAFAVGTGVASTGGSAAARGWQCDLCPGSDGWEGQVDAGAEWVSDAAPKFADYRGLDGRGGYLALGGDARYRDTAGRYVDAWATDLGVDSRAFWLRGGVRGRYEVSFAYREIPKYRGFGAETVYLGVGGNRLSLPAGWQPAPNTGAMQRLADSLQPASLELKRKTVDLGFRGRLGSRWSYDIGYEHQRKEGTRPFGAGVFTLHSSHFPAPVDFSTDRLGAGLSFRGETVDWRLGLSASEFDNGNADVSWPNPFTAIAGTEFLRASLEPDNRFYQAEFAGAWAPSRRLRFTGMAAVGRMDQDEPLLPVTSNPNFSDVLLPRTTAAARIDTGTFNLGGKADVLLTPRLALTARLRRDERDNRTPVDIFTPIITDIAPRDPRPNRPYSFQRERASVSLRYRASDWIRLQGGADRETLDRSLQSVLQTEEQGYWGEVRLRSLSIAELRIRLERADRDAGPYLLLDDGGPVEHPLMRKFHLADRQRDQLRADLDLFVLGELTVTAGYRSGQDEYSQSVLGLREAEESALTLDAGWSAGKRFEVNAFVSKEEIESLMASAETALSTPWTGRTRDRFLTAGFGLRFRLAEDSLIGFDVVHAGSEGDVRVAGETRGGAFPRLETELLNVRASVETTVTERWGLKAWLEFESYDSSDWALDGLGPDGIPAILAFGQASPDYDVLVLGLQARYRF